MEVNEPVAAYGQTYIQGLKRKLFEAIDQTDDGEKLEHCLQLFHGESMPCVYTEEELADVIRISEEHGLASEERVRALFAGWGL